MSGILQMKDEISSSDGATMRFMLVYKKTHSKKKNNTLDKLLARKKKPRGLFVVFAVDLFCFLNKLFCYHVFPLYRQQMPAVLCKGKCSARKTPGCHQYNWQRSLTD